MAIDSINKKTNTPRVYLAPMAGITDAAMREVCAMCGAQMTVTEMVSAKGLSYKSRRTKDLLSLSPLEKQASVQLFGSDPALLADMARWVEDELGDRLHSIDLNMGCPAPKIVNNGEGSALMRDLPLASRIIGAVKKAICVPLSVKFRAGFSADEKNAAEFARMAEEAGADILTVHGRTREQYYGGKADWGIIREVKRNAGKSMRVIGNGDITDAQSAAAMLEQTGCDAVMVARGALGNPFIFTKINEFLESGQATTIPTPAQKAEMCLRQARLAIQNKGEKLAMMQMRTHAAHYIKGAKHATRLREAAVRVSTYNELETLLLTRYVPDSAE